MGGSVISCRVCRICYVAYALCDSLPVSKHGFSHPTPRPGDALHRSYTEPVLTRAYTLSAHYLSRLLAANHHVLGHPRCCNSPARPMPTRLPAPRERDDSASDRMNALFAPQRTTERVAQRRNSAALAIAADDMEGLASIKSRAAPAAAATAACSRASPRRSASTTSRWCTSRTTRMALRCVPPLAELSCPRVTPLSRQPSGSPGRRWSRG